MNYFYYDSNMAYPMTPPYDPGQDYPEYPFSKEDMGHHLEKNTVYDSLREMLFRCGLDRTNYGTREWNPFGNWVTPGMTVLLKPNLVMDHNPAEEDPVRGLDCMITHPSIVRFVFDYVVIALHGTGKIIVGDAPVQDCDFEKLESKSGYGSLFDYMKEEIPKGITFISGDFRDTCLTRKNGVIEQKDNPNKIFSGKVIDLGNESYFSEYKNKKKLRVTNYDGADTAKHHMGGKNEYCVNSGVLEADVIFNLCKPKTHRIAGYTGAMKNLVGMNSRKEYLPHHTQGYKRFGGDEFSDGHLFMKYINSRANEMKNRAMKNNNIWWSRWFDELGRKTGKYLDKKEPNRDKFGMWHQNDTIWRTILDLNHLILFCNEDGIIEKKPVRRIINLGDLVVSGEKEGPLCPSYKHVGGLLLSDSVVEFDYILVRLMGFDPKAFPVLTNAITDKILGINLPVTVCSNDGRFAVDADEFRYVFSFIPTGGWQQLLGKKLG